MSWLSLVGISMVIGMTGQVMKQLIGAKAGDTGWRGVYFVTFRAHALVAGAALTAGLWYLGLPLPAALGTELGGAIAHGLFAGMLAMVAYDVLYKGVRAVVQHRLAQLARGEE